MGRFVVDKRLEVYPFKDDKNKWWWGVSADTYWYTGIKGDYPILIEQGFTTDLGSIPPVARLFINPSDPQYVHAWILHDKILKIMNDDLAAGVPPEETYSAQFAVSQMYEAMRFMGANRNGRIAQYWAVNFGIAKGEW